MKINIRKSAVKDLKKINVKDKEKIHAKILELRNFPDIANIKKLTNFEPAYRFRVGNYVTTQPSSKLLDRING